MSILEKLCARKIITPPRYVPGGLQYLTIMGSEAYGVGTDISDRDVYGFCIPPKSIVFPHIDGHIPGFGKKPEQFLQYQQHHVLDPDTNYVWDFAVYNIVRYFQLCMENNPNMIDSLFTPERCVMFCTKIGDIVRTNRKLFLHKGAWFKYKGYAFSQMRKMKSQNREGKRKETVEQYGYDLKFAYHVVRLINEVEQILLTHDLSIDQNREQLKSIRAGEWTVEQIEKYFYDKEKSLEDLYVKSDLQHSPDENKIKAVLLSCLEEYYGSLDACVKQDEHHLINALGQIKEICDTFVE